MDDFFGINFGMNGMNDDDISRMVDTHPLSVFAKLADEDPKNKHYQQCLDYEIELAAQNMLDNMEIEQIEFIEHIVNMIPENLEISGHRIASESEIKSVLKRLHIIKRVFAKVHELNKRY